MALYAPLPTWHDEGPEVTSTSVLKRDIPWDTYSAARLITEADLKNIRLFDKKSPQTQEDILASPEGAAVISSLLAVLRNVTKEETVQYVLALLLDLVSADKGRAKLFFTQQVLPAGAKDDVYPVLLRLLQRADWYTQEKACALLTLLIDLRPGSKDSRKLREASPKASASPGANGSSSSAAVAADGSLEQAVVSFLDWLCSQLRRPSSPTKSVPAAVHALASLLKEQAVREMFTRSGGVPLLAPLLRMQGVPSPNPQMVYDAAVCVWNLTYYVPSTHLMHNAGIVPGLVELVKFATKEKALRVSLFALKNLLLTPGLEMDVDVMETGLIKAVAAKNACNFDDDDLTETLEWMLEFLERNIHEMSSWERYKKELLAGRLDWSPMHSSEKFWRENVHGFEEKDFQMLRVLLKMLEASRDARTLAVACFDLGQFVTYYPHGRQMVMDLRGKELVMRLMMHPDEGVQKQALLCVQKILLSKDKVDYLAAMK